MGNLSRDKNGWYDYQLIRMTSHGNVTPSQLQATQIQAMIETQDAVHHNMMVQQECVEMQHAIGQGIEMAISQTTAALHNVDQRLASIERNQAEHLGIIKRERAVKEWLFRLQETGVAYAKIATVLCYVKLIDLLKFVDRQKICSADFSELADKREFTSFIKKINAKVQDVPQEIKSDLSCFELWYCSYKESLHSGGYNPAKEQVELPKVIRVRDCAGCDTAGTVLSLLNLRKGLVIEPGQQLLKYKSNHNRHEWELRCPDGMRGKITKVFVKEGDVIRFETPLFQLDHSLSTSLKRQGDTKYNDYEKSMEQLGTKINKYIDEELGGRTGDYASWLQEKFPKLDIEKDLLYLKHKNLNDHYPHYSWFEEDDLSLCKLSWNTPERQQQLLQKWNSWLQNPLPWEESHDSISKKADKWVEDFVLAFLNETRIHLKELQGMKKNKRYAWEILNHMNSGIRIFQIGDPEKYICEYSKRLIVAFLTAAHVMAFGNFWLCIDLFKEEKELIEEARSIEISLMMDSEQFHDRKSFVKEIRGAVPFEPFQGLVPSELRYKPDDLGDFFTRK